jgi:glycosyltransferase involved in cell wall biosynthesis
VLGNVGWFSLQKDPLEWVRVAGKVAEQLPNCRFLLVGDGPLRTAVVSALSEHGLLEKSVLPGLRRDVAGMLAAMDVFLLTSRWEGLPRVLPQAMLMQRPVVAYAVDGCAEAIRNGQNGFAVAPGDSETAAARCLDLLQDARLRESFGICGRDYATSEFDLARMLRQLEQLYTQVL